MSRRMAAALCALVPLLASMTAAAALPAQNLLKGRATTLAVDYDIGDIAVADPAVCDFVVSKNRRQVYLNPRQSGSTTLTLWDAAGAVRDEVPITVFTTTVAEVLERANEAFGSLEGVEIALKGSRVELSGEVFDRGDLRAIEEFADATPGVASSVQIAPEVLKTITDSVGSAIATPGISVRAIRGRVVLDGVAYSAADAARALEIAHLYVPDAVSVIDVRDTGRRVGRAPMIELDIRLMEIKTSALKSLGIQWAPGAFPAGGGATASTGNAGGLLGGLAEAGRSIIGFVFNLIPRLKNIRERGDGRMLENPVIVIKSGEKGELFSGAEVPFFRGDDVQFKEVGVRIEAEPIVIGDEIDLRIKATLSAPSAHIEGAVDRNTVATSAICRRDQSVVLGGIVHNGDVTTHNRVPKGVDTSTSLFSLFLSKDFQSRRSEFVIFITPRIVTQTSAAEERIKAWIETDEDVMRRRSAKEYRVMTGARDGESAQRQTKRKKPRRWR